MAVAGYADPRPQIFEVLSDDSVAFVLRGLVLFGRADLFSLPGVVFTELLELLVDLACTVGCCLEVLQLPLRRSVGLRCLIDAEPLGGLGLFLDPRGRSVAGRRRLLASLLGMVPL